MPFVLLYYLKKGNAYKKEIHMAYSFRNPSDGIIKHYLETSKIIAVVGLSDREDTTSHRVSKEMQERGYRIIPVNPRAAASNSICHSGKWTSLIRTAFSGSQWPNDFWLPQIARQ